MPTSKESTEFPDVQRARLEEFYPAYEAFILEKNPEHKKNSLPLMKWRKEKAKSLMAEEIFQDLLKSSSNEYKDWEDAIRRFYTNYYNNIFLPALRRAAAAAELAASESSHSSTPLSPALSSGSRQPTSKALEDLYSRALVVFLGELSPREMFASENKDAIRKQMEAIQSENPESDLVGGGLRNKALKVLWAKADQNLWKSKMEKLAGDVDINRAEFPALIYQALQKLCTRKRLGSTLMSLSWAFRDESDGIKGGTIITGYDAYKQAPVTDDCKPIDHKTQLEAWFNHADAILSRKPRTAVYRIPVNGDGVPILPSVDLQEASASQVATLLDEYFLALWGFSWAGNESAPAIPWGNITQNPHRYFDTSTYKFPCELKSPQVLKSNPFEIFSVHQFLSSRSTSLPFRFRPYFEILEVDHEDDSDLEDESQTLPAISKGKAVVSSLSPSVSHHKINSASAPTAPSSPALGVSRIPSPISTSIPQISLPGGPSNNAIPFDPPTSKANEPATESSPVLPTSSGHPAKSPTLNDAVVTNDASSGEPVALTATKAKKGGSKAKTAKAKTRKVPATSGGSEACASRAPTRTSKRATDLKRKQPDTISTADPDTQPVKKTRVKDRWEWAA